MNFILIFFLQLPLQFPSGDNFGGGMTGGIMIIVLYLVINLLWEKFRQSGAKEQRKDEADFALKNVEMVSRIDFAKLGAEQIKTVAGQLQELVTVFKNLYNDEREAHTREREAHAKTKENFDKKLDALEEKHDLEIESIKREIEAKLGEIGVWKGKAESNEKALISFLRDSRMLLDSMGIACWQVTPEGKFYGNITFFAITGLKSEECQNDGWFTAIDDSDETYFSQKKWKNYIDNFQTRPVHRIRFRNVLDNRITESVVHCLTLLKAIDQPYLFIAHTEPLKRDRKGKAQHMLAQDA